MLCEYYLCHMAFRTDFQSSLFNDSSFEEKALALFDYQFKENKVYGYKKADDFLKKGGLFKHMLKEFQ